MKLLSICFALLHFCHALSKRETNPINVRIVGGQSTTILKHPYQAAIEKATTHTIRCGATIIARTWILSNAECLYFENATEYVVRVGTTYQGLGGTVVNISEVISHPDYNYDTLDYDIALIKLAEPIPLSSAAQIIRLANSGEEVVEGTMGSINGWGYTSGTSNSVKILRDAEVPVINHAVCSDLYATVGKVVTDRVFCAGFWNGGVDTCTFDDGGSFVVDSKVVGVSLWTRSCGFPQKFGWYTDVAGVREWITETTGI